MRHVASADVTMIIQMEELYFCTYPAYAIKDDAIHAKIPTTGWKTNTKTLYRYRWLMPQIISHQGLSRAQGRTPNAMVYPFRSVMLRCQNALQGHGPEAQMYMCVFRTVPIAADCRHCRRCPPLTVDSCC